MSSSWLSSWWLERAMTVTKPFARGRLLDVGCGAAPYRDYYAIDERVGIDWLGTMHDRSNIHAFASAEQLPFADASFDTVLCTEVLEHLRHPERAIAEASRVLRPGGHVILSVPFLYGIHEQPFDFFRYTEFGLRALLDDHGLDVVVLEHRGGSLSVAADLGGKVVHRVVRRALGAVRAPTRAKNVILGAAVVGPQRLFAAVVDIVGRRSPRSASFVGAEQVATLGYVIVARRR